MHSYRSTLANLLGLRGTISEVELHTMRNRLDRGKLHKAERGEEGVKLPTGEHP